MTLKGITYTEKAAAGEMLLAVCKEYPMAEPAEIGNYRGFKLEVFYDTSMPITVYIFAERQSTK